ncbi:hypothetical protein [Litoribacillus peritrichatus]|uniref:Uncharacterized protein n=1 Tax=Litoribacillus peritrichatus TaxID=718191 RepID=A0ABP7MQ96_9GAMM
MLYLYLGFLLGQSYSVIKVIYTANIPFLTIVFSVIVFLIWSFFPVIGYAVAKAIRVKTTDTEGCQNKYALLALGISISAIESVLYHYELITSIDDYWGMLITALMFSVVALLPVNKLRLAAY